MGKKQVQAPYRPGGLRATSVGRQRGRWALERCRWCRCTYFDPCPEGCGWANREHTLCTACVNVDREWRRLIIGKVPNMRRAFFRGYLVGANDERRADEGRSNPYTGGGRSLTYWKLGVKAGEKEAR